MDPLSVAGLSLAILDQLIKLSERTAELISDIKAFDEDTTYLYDRVVNESNKTITLRRLLFENALIYGGETLFQQFEPDVQEQIRIKLRQLKTILGEVTELLEQRYRSKSSADKSNRASSSTSSIDKETALLNHSPPNLSSYSLSPIDVSRKNTASPLRQIQWSIWDKKRVGAIVRNFKDLNNELHDQIKFYCNASTLGVDLGHLQRLQNDASSRALGFDMDANLRLTAYDNQCGNPSESFELQGESWTALLQSTIPVSTKFSIAHADGRTLLLEKFAYDHLPSTSSENLQMQDISPRTRRRVDALAKLLRQPKEQVFRIPRCIGWKYHAQQKSIAFVFEIQPERLNGMPMDLLQLLGDREARVSLGDKFMLALALAKCISQLHMVKWVHESFRSENVLFFPNPSIEKGKPAIEYTEPWVLGFEFSRPDIFVSTGVSDYCPSRDLYRHPERQGEPDKAFTKKHDIYALGVVLLEIGLWEPALTFERNNFAYVRDPYAVQKQLMKYAERRLESRVGKKYRDVVLSCLSGDFDVANDTKEDLKLQQAFRKQVVNVLELAAENV
ncbi:hypothetical protein F5882DRAFT_503016 [Hyaloscypha sp. PMI_1271]|nr:hypothetical protein F5882DRAFT_503016 [Hyaloscypha sp. PMI_1271]